MSAFQGLLKKDFDISKFWFLLWGIVIVLLLIISRAMEIYFHTPLTFLPFTVMMLFGFHIFFLPAMLLSMLHLEGKTQFWLYNPQSSKVLLLSKIIVCFIYQLIAQIFLTAIGLMIYQIHKAQFMIETASLMKGITIINIGLLLAGLYFSCLFMFFWAIYHSLKKFPALKNWRWLVIVLVFLIYDIILTLLSKIEFLREIVQKWSIPVTMDLQLHYEKGAWKFLLNTTDIPILELVLYVIEALCLFLISCWLLDRKVEV